MPVTCLHTSAIPQERGRFEATLVMLQHVARHIWTAARWMQTPPQDTQQRSMLLGVWQAPGLLCTMHTCWHPHPSLLLHGWPLIVPGEAANFLHHGEPDGDPQAVLCIGFEKLSEAEQWPEELRCLIPLPQHGRNKVKSQRWGFHPDGLDPFLEEIQRLRRTRGKMRARREADAVRAQKIERLIECRRAQKENQLPEPLFPGPLFQRTFYLSPKRKDVERACLLLVIFLFQAGLGLWWSEYDALRTWEARYLVDQWRCADLGHACVVFDTLLHHMVGNEHWRASGKYIARVVKETRERGSCIPTQKPLKAPYSVKSDVVRILAAEGNGAWVPSRDWLYDQINAERIPCFLDAKGQKRVDEAGLEAVRKLVKETHTLQQRQQLRKGLMEYQKEMGKSEAAAKKWIQRRLGLGDTLEDIVKALLSADRKEPNDAYDYC